jgi:cyclopropane fatty-acyl-phospholipid synthase-like methyltransferase
MARLGIKALARALLGDMAQRVLTANKTNQRAVLASALGALELPSGAKALDFGCGSGSGLFAPVFAKLDLNYTGFNIDAPSLHIGELFHSPPACFTSSLDEAATLGPFDCILANCCFHHTSTPELHSLLERFKTMLVPGGVFLLVDILAVENDPSPVHRWFMTLEQGRHVRLRHEYDEILSRHFRIVRSGVYRGNILSIPLGRIPIGNDVLLMESRR